MSYSLTSDLNFVSSLSFLLFFLLLILLFPYSLSVGSICFLWKNLFQVLLCVSLNILSILYNLLLIDVFHPLDIGLNTAALQTQLYNQAISQWNDVRAKLFHRHIFS